MMPARAPCLLVLLALLPACITAQPSAPPTQPFLSSNSANPPPSQVIVVDTQDPRSVILFSAEVFSLDDREIETNLYIDYGSLAHGPAGSPFLASFPGTTIAPGEPRLTSAEWPLDVLDVKPGCHTATLVVSHQLDNLGCPACDNDTSTITWQVLRCDSANGSCDQLPLGACQALDNSCPLAREKAGLPEQCLGP